ncbi:two-component sensor histidine kinase [Actinomadura craniellae]|uniref:Signal transduction histidine-protein kinase/phosphatase MprB n=1 Tax=Actinomadura craniellae TaxID=2231787 RepID=A0A365GVH1_9ACTN|nr:HAMP domain-containing sensor histidine kinase [Actinomadura craniellae]RAY10784.1 two-component sensor histidine kinase [Actinomadura craniellae]
MIPRPLDPLRSIKLKLGLLVVASTCATALVLKEALEAGVRGRYALVVAVLASLVVTQVLAHGMTSPLRHMTAVARAMAAGRHDRRVRASSRDEVGELARAFNTMADELAEVERRRRDFIANVSHELRTPISALHAQLENIADGVTPVRPDTLRVALDQTERLGRLVTQLLDLSRVDGGGALLDRTRFDVRPFLDAAVEQARAAHPRVRFSADAPPGLTVSADRDRLHQVVANLLDNAARHGRGTVTVTARAGLVLEVTDDGPGIPRGERDRVFERFSRGGSYGADGGTGLGLAIARWAVDLHGGRIEVVDAARGCRIRAVIPD